MNSKPPMRRFVLAAPVAVAAWFAFAGVPASSPAESGARRTQNSVCEAQALKAAQARDPHLEIEIPAEFNTPWPTAEACASYAAAADVDAPGPGQPIPFSHKHHTGLYQIDCLYCHAGADRSPSAGVPSVETCMGCHGLFPPAYDAEFEGIRILKEHWEAKRPIEWNKIHRVPEYVQFRHNSHVRAGVECQQCHGPAEELDKLYMTADTKWWPWMLPTAKLEMGWCVQCHRENKASQDCLTCHY